MNLDEVCHKDCGLTEHAPECARWTYGGVRVERCEPHTVWDLHQIFSTTVHGYLHLPPGVRMTLQSTEAVDVLEAVFRVADAAVAWSEAGTTVLRSGLATVSAFNDASRALHLAVEHCRRRPPDPSIP